MTVVSTFRSARLRKALSMVRLGFECETLNNLNDPPDGHPLKGIKRVTRFDVDQMAYQNYFDQFGVDAGWDGGRPEYRTRGPLTYAQAVQAANEVFKLNHTFNQDCAFHVHISLYGEPTRHSPRMQRDMTEYVLAHMSSVPESVRKRWATGGLVHCPPNIMHPGVADVKGPFVSHRSSASDANIRDGGTWEFRCFGNVTNAVDADRCLRLAVRAFRYAHRRVEKVRPVATDSPDIAKWKTLCSEAALQGLSINTVFQRVKINREKLAVA